MRIGIDIDDTLYDFDGTARSVLYVFDTDPKGSRLPEPLTEAQRTDLVNGINYEQWDGIEKIVGPVNWSWLWEHANDTNLFQRGLPLLGALPALKTLAKKHEVWLMTARDQKWSHQTYSWLYRFKVDAAGVVHGKSKWEVAADLDFRVVVDDGPKNLKGYLKMTEPIYGGKFLYNTFIYGIKRYEPVQSRYERFRYVDSLLDVVEDHERWEG